MLRYDEVLCYNNINDFVISRSFTFSRCTYTISCIHYRLLRCDVSLPNLIKPISMAWHHQLTRESPLKSVLQSFNQLSPICISSDGHLQAWATKYYRASVESATLKKDRERKKTFNFRGELIKCECQNCLFWLSLCTRHIEKAWPGKKVK